MGSVYYMPITQIDLQFGFLFASHPDSEHFSHILGSSAMPDFANKYINKCKINFANKIQGAQLNLNFRKAANAFLLAEV